MLSHSRFVILCLRFLTLEFLSLVNTSPTHTALIFMHPCIGSILSMMHLSKMIDAPSVINIQLCAYTSQQLVCNTAHDNDLNFKMESFHSRMESLKYRQSELDDIADNECHTNLILNCTRALHKFDYCYAKFCSLPSTSLLEYTIILLQDSK